MYAARVAICRLGGSRLIRPKPEEVEITNSDSARSQVAFARFAGFMFLFVDAAYALGLFITSRFVVPENFAETAHKIIASEALYRIGLSSGLVGGLCTI